MAATSYAHRYGVATLDREDFERIADRIAAAAPGGPPLDVVPPGLG
jgi:hypothetical protein